MNHGWFKSRDINEDMAVTYTIGCLFVPSVDSSA